MKEFLETIAAVILSVIVWISGMDINNYSRNVVRLEDVAQKSASCAITFVDTEELADGYIVINDAEALEAVDYFVQARLSLNADITPKDSAYWQDNPKITVYIFDDTQHDPSDPQRGEMRKYVNGTLTEKEAFTFGTVFDEPESARSKAIINPTVGVVIKTGTPKFLISSVNAKAAMSGFYTWADRNSALSES